MARAGFYNPLNRSWNSISLLPEKKEGAAVCTLNSSIYIIGGHYNGHFFKSVWAYCTETKVWVSVADLNSPRSYSGKVVIILNAHIWDCNLTYFGLCLFVGAVVMNGFIYVFGGKTDNKTYSNTFEVYNPHSNEWITSSASMNKDRCHIDAIVIEKNCTLFKRVFEDATNNIIH